MNLWLWIARSIAATILGLLIFVSFMSFLLVSNFTGKLLNVSTYTVILNQQDTYSRLYDAVLLDPQPSGITGDIPGDILGSIQWVSQREMVQIVRRIAPPDYLQAEVEKNLLHTIEYLNRERDALELEIDLREPLTRVEPAIFEYIDRRIDELDTVDIDPAQDPREQLAEVEELIYALVWDVASGQPPKAVPAIGFIPAPLRVNVFDSFLPGVLGDPRIDPRVRQGLQSNVTAIRSRFVAGDTRQFWKEVAHAGLTPLIDQGIVDVNRYTDEPGRLDLIAIAAENSDGFTEETLRDRLDRFRDRFRRGTTLGGGVALTVAIAATMVMFLIYLPSLVDAMRWPGLTLLLTGLVLFVLGKFLERTLPRQIYSLVQDQVLKVPDLPPPAATLVNGLAQQLINHLFTGLANPALIILLVGGLLFGGSFVLNLLRAHLLRPVAPWVR